MLMLSQMISGTTACWSARAESQLERSDNDNGLQGPAIGRVLLHATSQCSKV